MPRLLSGVALAALFILSTACSEDPRRVAPPCEAECGARSCGDDGCGGSCGDCTGDMLCSAAGQCEPGDRCTDSCASEGAECGEVCGESCGSCSGEQMGCVDGRCECLPACDVNRCGQADGCGGRCGACPVSLSCEDCPLQLSLLSSSAGGFVVALDLADGDALPGLADLSFGFDRPVEVVSATLAESVAEGGKALYRFTRSNQLWRWREDGGLQMMIVPASSTQPLPPGRLLTLELRDPGADASGYHPVSVWLQRREAMLAPAAADAALQLSSYDGRVVVAVEADDAR